MFFKVQISFKDGDNKTILENLEQQFMKVTKLNLNLCTTYTELCKNFERTDRETDRNACFY